MASLYKRNRSPFWWIEYIDASGERRQESTKLRYAITSEARKARELQREMTRREQTRDRGERRDEAWANWVPRFITQRYGDGQEKTRERYEAAWRNLAVFLEVRGIIVPRQLTRQQVRDYIAWRKGGDAGRGVYKGKKNTALTEVKFLRLVMDEAMESGFCTSNPCAKLGIGRDDPKEKPRITTEEHRLITRLLKRKPEWMRVSYRIAWESGCRFDETHLRLPRDVDLARNVIGLRTKGQKTTVAEVPLSPRLRPLFRRLIESSRTETFAMPNSPGKKWSDFFKRAGLPHLCFHCTRVTFITRCYEAGIPKEDVMRLCLHASETVHRIYPRLPATSQHLQDRMRQLTAAA